MSVVLGQVSYGPIQIYNTIQGLGFPAMIRQREDATQTFKMGVPTKLVSGYIQECAFSAADVVYGVNAEKSHNLAAAGTAQDLSEGTPQNQPSAITTPVGAWIRDGKIGLYQANGNNVFSVSLKTGQVFTQALVLGPATLYRLIKDGTTGFWYLDNTLTGGNAGVANLLGMDPSSPNTTTGGCRVFFQFAEAQRAFQ